MADSKAIAGIGTLLQIGDGGVGAGTQASRTIGTSNQQIVIKAKVAGTAGNSKTCSIVVSGTSTAFALSVTENNITITSATDGGGSATTTVNEALYQLSQDDTFAEFWEATRGAGNGTGVLVAGSSAALTGGLDGAEVFTTIAEVRNLTGPGMTRETLEATHLGSDSGYREWVVSFIDSGEVSFDVNFLPGDDSQEALIDDLVSGVKRNFRVIWPTVLGKSQRTWAFTAYVVGFNPSVSFDGLASSAMTLRATGEITLS